MIKSSQSTPITNESGFSLVELIIAICILSILSSIIVNGFERQNHNDDYNTAQLMLNYIESGRRRSMRDSTMHIDN